MKKNPFVTLFIAILAITCICYGVFGIHMYNKLVQLRNDVYEQQAQVENVLQARWEKIPDLVKEVESYNLHEEKVLREVTEARSALLKAIERDDMAAISTANDQLSTAVYNLQAVVEDYPELQSSRNYVALMDETSEAVNKISQERRIYNQKVKAYNTYVESYWVRPFALLFGFERIPYFIASEEAHNANVVEFSGDAISQ